MLSRRATVECQPQPGDRGQDTGGRAPLPPCELARRAAPRITWRTKLWAGCSLLWARVLGVSPWRAAYVNDQGDIVLRDNPCRSRPEVYYAIGSANLNYTGQLYFPVVITPRAAWRIWFDKHVRGLIPPGPEHGGIPCP